MKRLSLLFIITCASTFSIYAQNRNIITSRTYPQDYFRKALNITPDASGTFGELRSTHFHAGDDYRTQQKIGLPLYAAAEGFVSRVRVQIGGGGNSVYIDHPNGYTTVYLHMDRFSDALTSIIRAQQYKQKRFDVDVLLQPQQLKLTKSELIGYAGNTGGSGGPHLHFEIRDTKSQHPLNPQLFGLHFTDNFAPTIQGLVLYDLNDSIFNEFTPRTPLPVKAIGSNRNVVTNSQPILVNGKFSFGIMAIDRLRAGGFKNGVYSIELFLDGKPISTIVFEELDFNTSRGVHAHIDYAHWKKTAVKAQKSFKDPGNPIEIHKFLKEGGIMELKDDAIHDVKYVVKDVHGNCSDLDFKIKNNSQYKPAAKPRRGEQLLEYNKANAFSAANVKLTFPIGVLYDHVDFTYMEGTKLTSSYSTVHHIHNELTPLFASYSLSIKATDLPDRLQSKALIASVKSGSEGGKFENGWVTVNTRNFGSFYIAVDTIAPIISPRNLTNGKNLAAQAKIDFTISDNFSGIQSFDGYIDGQWVLMEYDSKNRHLWHRFEPSLAKGKHQFRLVVKDWKDNDKTYEVSFLR